MYSESSSESNASVKIDLSIYSNNEDPAGTNNGNDNPSLELASIALITYIHQTSTNQIPQI